MTCPKCTTGTMRPDNDFTGRETSQRCLICGYRTWNDFTVRPATDRDKGAAHGSSIMPGLRRRQRQTLTAAEKEQIVTLRGQGTTYRVIAEQLQCSQGIISRIMNDRR